MDIGGFYCWMSDIRAELEKLANGTKKMKVGAEDLERGLRKNISSLQRFGFVFATISINFVLVFLAKVNARDRSKTWVV